MEVERVRLLHHPPSILIVTTSLPDGIVTFDYTETIRASGGVAPFVWKVNTPSR